MRKLTEINTNTFEYNSKYNILTISRREDRKWKHHFLVENVYSKATISIFSVITQHNLPSDADIRKAKRYVDDNYNVIGAEFLQMEEEECI